MCLSSYFEWANKQIPKLKWYDISLVKLATAIITLMFVKWFPILLALDWYWYLILAILVASRPWYIIFYTKTPVTVKKTTKVKRTAKRKR